jgi:hypothetical protein
MTEHEPLAKEERVILVEYVEDGERNKCLRPIIVGNQSINDLSRFLVKETEELRDSLTQLEARKLALQTRKKPHGKIRGERELHVELEKIRDEQLGVIPRLTALEGKAPQPIRVFMERGTIERWELAGFFDRENYHFWNFIRENDLLLTVAEIERIYPKSVDILFDAYTLITRSKTGNPEIRDDAKSLYEELLLSYKKLPEKQIERMTPLMQKIAESIVKS